MRKPESADARMTKRAGERDKHVQGAADEEPGAHLSGQGARERRRAMTGRPPEDEKGEKGPSH